MRLLPVSLVASSLLLVAGCTVQTSKTLNDASLNAEADGLYRDVIGGQDEAARARFSSTADVAEIEAQFPLYRTIAGEAPIPSAEVRATQKQGGTDGAAYSVTHHYTYSDRLIETQTRFVMDGEAWKVNQFNLTGRLKTPATAPASPTAASTAPAA